MALGACNTVAADTEAAKAVSTEGSLQLASKGELQKLLAPTASSAVRRDGSTGNREPWAVQAQGS